MVRTNRRLTRFFLIAVLAALLLGGWFASRSIPVRLEGIEVAGAEEGDWIEIVSALGEEAIQLFIGLASD